MSQVARRKRNMKPEQIRAALRAAGFPTIQHLADSLGRGRSTVSEVISGSCKSAYIAEAIGRCLGKRPSEIWPRVYSEPDLPLAM